MESVRIERISVLPRDFGLLRTAAESEGFRHLARLEDDWESAAERFDGPGEALFGAFDGTGLAGVGGVTREPTAPETLLRARRFCVRPESRAAGVGSALVAAVVAHAHGHADRLLVNSNAVAMAFWDRAGFVRIDRPGVTHERMLGIR